MHYQPAISIGGDLRSRRSAKIPARSLGLVCLTDGGTQQPALHSLCCTLPHWLPVQCVQGAAFPVAVCTWDAWRRQCVHYSTFLDPQEGPNPLAVLK